MISRASRPGATTALTAASFVLATTLVGCGSDDPSAVNTASSASSGESQASTSIEPGTVQRFDVRVVAEIDRAPDGFTQGFVFDDDGRLWESVGLEGASAIRQVDPDTGEVLERVDIAADQFAEGLSVGPHGLVQLTWTDGVAYRWATDPLTPTGEFRYAGEGWGLTFNGSAFVQSDGSSTLTWRDGSTFEVTATVPVSLEGQPVAQLNELEWVDGSLFANVWHSEDIMRIDPDTGEVDGVIDASGLWESPERTSEMTLNGIAHRPGDPATRLWLTGKNWPKIVVVDLVEVPS